MWSFIGLKRLRVSSWSIRVLIVYHILIISVIDFGRDIDKDITYRPCIGLNQDFHGSYKLLYCKLIAALWLKSAVKQISDSNSYILGVLIVYHILIISVIDFGLDPFGF